MGNFGAAGGALMLAVLRPLFGQSVVWTIAVKNAISGSANAVAALAFAVFGPVRRRALRSGYLLGCWIGPAVVRRLPDRGLGSGVGFCGLAMAVTLGVDSYRKH